MRSFDCVVPRQIGSTDRSGAAAAPGSGEQEGSRIGVPETCIDAGRDLSRVCKVSFPEASWRASSVRAIQRGTRGAPR